MLPETAPVVEAGKHHLVEAGEHHLVVADSFGLNGPKNIGLTS